MANVAQLGRWGILSLALFMAACGEGGDDADADADASATGPNTAPSITGAPVTTIAQGASYTFAPSAVDNDGDSLTFGITGKPAWAAFDTSSGRLTGSPAPTDAGTYTGIVIWVSDGDAQTTLPAFDVTVGGGAPVNGAPIITGTPAPSVNAGSAYTFTPASSDPEGNLVSYSIANRPTWAAFNTTTGRLSGTPQVVNAGTFANIVITASDGEDSASLPAFSIVVVPPAVNGPPVISGVPMTVVEAGTQYLFVPSADDPEDNALTFSASGVPSWAGFDARTGRLAGQPPIGTTGITGNIVIRVTDGTSTATLPAFSITVTAPTSNRAPTITGAPAGAATEGAQYTFQPSAADADGNTLTFTIANRPTWATFNSNTGRLQGTPGSTNVRTYSNIVIGVSDGKASATLPAFSIAVAGANDAPTISGSPATTATVGTLYTFRPTAADADGDTLTFSITNKPSWATFTASTGRIQGTPAAANVGTVANIVISVSDSKLSAQLAAFSIVVSDAPNRAPTISGSPSTVATPGTQYSFQPTATDPDGDTLTFTIANKPSWATFTASTGRLQGTPAVGDVGTSAGVVISVSDGKVSAQLGAFSIAVSDVPNRAPTISGSPSTAVMQGTQYTFQPSAADADNDTLTFAIANKPSWATFTASTGRLQGTPAAGDVGTTSGIVISVTDGEATKALAAFNVTVQAVATGSATLSWTPPTQNTDGTALTNLSGYKIYWGPAQGTYPNSTTVNNAGITSYVVTDLVPGTYFFTATALNAAGAESEFAGTATKTIQ